MTPREYVNAAERHLVDLLGHKLESPRVEEFFPSRHYLADVTVTISFLVEADGEDSFFAVPSSARLGGRKHRAFRKVSMERDGRLKWVRGL